MENLEKTALTELQRNIVLIKARALDNLVTLGIEQRPMQELPILIDQELKAMRQQVHQMIESHERAFPLASKYMSLAKDRNKNGNDRPGRSSPD